MIQNYFKIAWRNLLRNKGYSLINIVGLAIGVATCLIIMLFVQDELSFDRYNDKADRIVRVVFRGIMNGEKMKESHAMPPTAQTLRKDFPEVLDATRIRYFGGGNKISYGEKTFVEERFGYVDSNFFQVFTLPLLKGDAKTALVEPHTLVITQEIASKYFGLEDPIGKILYFKDSKVSYKVTGVIDKVPANSHFHFDFFGSMAGVEEAKQNSWLSSSFYTYLVLPVGYDYKLLEAKLPQEVEKYIGPQLKEAMGMNLHEFRQKGNDVGLYLQPLTDIHLHSDFANDLEASGDIRYVYIFGAIALFMLLIAGINFTNLSTAGASKRAKEVGIRKTLGSGQSELVGQFLLESVLLSFIALVLAVVFVKLALPVFNGLANKSLSFHLLDSLLVIPGLLLFGLLIGGLAGIYPAFFLSSFRPIAVLKTKFSGTTRSLGLRSGLVVFQFIISVSLIVGVMVVYKQLSYIQNIKLGFDKEQLLVMRGAGALKKSEVVFKEQLLHDPRVVDVSVSDFFPTGPTNTNLTSFFPDGDKSLIRRTFTYQVDDRYIPTMGIELALGRNFSKEFPTDSLGVIINETAAKIFGWGAGALGHSFHSFTDNNGSTKSYQVIGVVKDFHFKSLHERIEPLCMVLAPNSGLIVKVKTKDISGLLASMKTMWAGFHVEEPFSYSFLDEDFRKSYVTEQKTGVILSIFAGLTIFVACLGLFGLATFTADQRTKEIGVRKVLGASVGQIVGLLSKDFLKLVLIACLIAFPLAWWGMNKWLQDFAYRTEISVWVFVLAGVAALLIALLTVSYQAVRAAVSNPVKSLRTE